MAERGVNPPTASEKITGCARISFCNCEIGHNVGHKAGCIATPPSYNARLMPYTWIVIQRPLTIALAIAMAANVTLIPSLKAEEWRAAMDSGVSAAADAQDENSQGTSESASDESESSGIGCYVPPTSWWSQAATGVESSIASVSTAHHRWGGCDIGTPKPRVAKLAIPRDVPANPCPLNPGHPIHAPPQPA